MVYKERDVPYYRSPGCIIYFTSTLVTITEIINCTRHWHIASYFLLENLIEFWPEWLRKLKTDNITVSLDTNWDPACKWTTVKEILPYIDVFLPNEAEALSISGESDIMTAGKKLLEICPIVVIKWGEKGAIVFTKDMTIVKQVSESLKESINIVDTTGAGDNFDAGFIRNWLLNKPINECLELAIECGTYSLSALGGIKGQVIREIT